MIKVYIVSGFLGSGKTTLIKKILASDILPKPMLIENEFGDIGIDGDLFDAGLKVKEINSGCICCSLKGDLVDALADIKAMDIESLIIEPSGVGKLSEVMMTIMEDDDLKLASHICMVDAKKALSYHRNFKEFFDDQVIAASAIILSKVDLIAKEDLEETKKMLKQLNEEVVIVDQLYRDLSASELLKIMTDDVCQCEECSGCIDEEELDRECGHHHHHHHADEVFQSIAIKTDRHFTKDELIAILKKIKDEVIRVKGIVLSDKLYLYFDISGDDVMVTRSNASSAGKVVVIGHDLDEGKIKGLFG